MTHQSFFSSKKAAQDRTWRVGSMFRSTNRLMPFGQPSQHEVGHPDAQGVDIDLISDSQKIEKAVVEKADQESRLGRCIVKDDVAPFPADQKMGNNFFDKGRIDTFK
jgi:hypothetical protein